MFSQGSALGGRRASQLTRAPVQEVRADKAAQGLTQAGLDTPHLEMSAELLEAPRTRAHDLRGCPGRSGQQGQGGLWLQNVPSLACP